MARCERVHDAESTMTIWLLLPAGAFVGMRSHDGVQPRIEIVDARDVMQHTLVDESGGWR